MENGKKNNIRKTKITLLIIVIFILVASFTFYNGNEKKQGLENNLSEDTSSTKEEQELKKITWQKFKDFDEDFKGILPDDPGYQTQEISLGSLYGPVTNYIYDAFDSQERNYRVSKSPFPKEYLSPNPRSDIQDTLDGMFMSTHGELVSATDIESFGYPATDFIITVPDDNLTIKGRLILAKNILYQIIVVYHNTTPLQDEDYNTFIEGFEIL